MRRFHSDRSSQTGCAHINDDEYRRSSRGDGPAPRCNVLDSPAQIRIGVDNHTLRCIHHDDRCGCADRSVAAPCLQCNQRCNAVNAVNIMNIVNARPAGKPGTTVIFIGRERQLG
ncbi:hypothetical protein Veis_4402 [Verminephrobacter eiseniae EF01-2]|uniref:Uncharacterized protein n=1 Tax=Verminephrobacter eiseniae (strain EF01-2) TaxID=391735 RepID=A1WR48_VEREI|nr:hypothetical protein Veis_4402 [Verminephrobacter eiseniae EF01-2]